MARITYDQALADWRRVAATSDRAWEAYRKARERVVKERSKWPTEEKLANLRVACSHKANDDVWLEVRARLAKAPEYGETNERTETLLNQILHGTV